MKTIPTNPINNSNQTLNGTFGFNIINKTSLRGYSLQQGHGNTDTVGSPSTPQRVNPDSTSILTKEAAIEITSGSIPDMTQLCSEIYRALRSQNGPASTLAVVPVLKKLNGFTGIELEKLVNHPKSSHVLIQNEWLKVVLICWQSGKVSSIHGHAQGGCVFKVLNGQVEEKRYTPDEASQLLGVSTFQSGAMAYIDDEMAYHAVGNPFDTPAISLHVYTQG